MNSKRPMFWHQGLFLQPQHFQYADAHHHWSANVLARQLRPHHWGVVELGINEERIASGVIEVEHATLLFRDGTVVQAPDNALIAPRDFRADWDPSHSRLDVYVGVRRLVPAAPNVTVVTDRHAGLGATTRFVSLADSPPMPDLHQGGEGTAQVKTLHYVLRLFWGHELAEAEEYELLPLTRLVRDGESVQLAADYAPPSLTVGAATALLRMLREIREEIIGRAHQLEEYKSPSNSTSEFSPKLIRYRLALQALGRYAPLIAHYADTPQIHPFELYGHLRQLVGELSVFAQEFDILGTPAGQANGLPTYDHHNAGGCFRAARTLIEKLLNGITVGPELMVTLEPAGPNRFVADLPREFLDRRASLYLVLRTETPFEQLLDSFLQYAKLGAAHEVDTYLQRALPGLPATYMKVRPEALPQRPNANYFRLERHDSRWDAVEGERSLALLWDDAPEDLKLELVLVRR